MESVTISDFSGGITDNYVDCAPNQYQKADNFLITADKKLISRPGSKLFDANHAQIPLGLKRLNTIFSKDADYFFGSVVNLFHYSLASGFTELVGPTGNPVCPQGDVNGFFCNSVWNNTIIVSYDDYTNNYFSIPSKIYKDENDEWQVRTVGLPEMTGVVATPATAGTTNVYTYKLCYFTSYYVGTKYFEDWGSFQTVQATVDSSDLSANAVTLSNIPIVINTIGGQLLNYATGNLATGVNPTVATMTSATEGVVTFADHGMVTGNAVYFSTTGTLPTNVVAGTIYYAIVINSSTFYLATSYANALAGAKIDTSAGAQSGVHTCYQVKIYVKIFRSQKNGTDQTYLATIANGVTSYSDSALDTAIVDNEQPYTAGGVLDNDSPPPAKYVHVANGVCWYGHVKEGNEILPYRVMQSIKDDVDSVPADSYIDLEDSVAGVSSYLDRVVAFCDSMIYRIDGYLDEVGGGALAYQRLHNTAGCLSNNSIVRIPQGIVWAGKDGFYFTDGMSIQKITNELNDTFKAFSQIALQKKRIYGNYDASNDRVYWSVQSGVGATDDSDMCFVLDLAYGIRPQSTFTTLSGKNNYSPTAFTFNNGDMIRGDKRGYIFQHYDHYLNDPTIDDTVLTSEWGTDAIIYHHISSASSMGSLMLRKFTPRIVIDTFNMSDLSLQVISNNDLGKLRTFLKPLRNRGSIFWGDPLKQWGESSIKWNNKKLIEEQRHIGSNALRCSYKQIEFTNAKVVITNSDILGNATVNLNDVTLESATLDWPEDCVGHFLVFEDDEYVNEYQITKLSGKTVTVLDPYKKDVTITEASEGVVSLIGHGHSIGDAVSFLSNGVLPNGIVAGTNYYVIPVDANSYKLATSYNNAIAQFAIDTSGGSASGSVWERSLSNGSKKFMLKGFPKNEILNFMSFTLHYTHLGKTQTAYTSSEAGNNE